MNKPSSFSLRGRRALVAIKDERDLSIVRRQFERLGIDIFAWEPGWEPGGALECQPDVALIDDEFLPLTSPAQRALPGRCPVIALLGTETPSRLKLVLELDPASFLVKPLRSAGLYTALVVAFDCAQRRLDEAAHIEKLEDRVRSRRVVFAAVLQMMRGHGLSEADAFTLIRQTAMRHRTTIEQLSAEIMAAGGMPNRTTRTA